MSMEKRGVIDENTPQEAPPAPAGGCESGRRGTGCTPGTKEAADAQQDSLTTRAADAAREAHDAAPGG